MTGSTLRVRPRASVLRTAIVSLLVAMVPASVALYAIAIPAGRWPTVLVVQVVVLALCAAVGLRQLRLVTEVDAHELRGNGIATPMVRVPLDRIARVHLIRTAIHSGAEETTQLLVTDAEGARLFRLRGNWWPPGALERIAAALPVAPIVEDETVPITLFWREHPGSAYWFEDKRLMKLLIPACVVVIASGVAAGVMFGLAD